MPEVTSPGGQVAMSEQDAAIVRRIRELCPDRRFDGGSDAELLDVFRRNKRVLARCDEDVIAAMTRPRSAGGLVRSHRKHEDDHKSDESATSDADHL